jgi:hypothetical protein
MARISAAGNLNIEMSSDQWRLLGNGSTREQVLVEAAPGQPLRYVSLFAQKRKLPEGGELPRKDIQRVVLGWSSQDEAWHLGLLLESELAARRGSRWCEIAQWPDPDTTVFGELAEQAGRALAAALACPFNLIPPQPVAAPAAPPPPPLPALPLELDGWTLTAGAPLVFVRARRWARTRAGRILWYSALAAAYVVLSVLSLTGSIAPTKPEFLPLLGLAVAVLLVGAVLYTLMQLRSQPGRIVVDAARQRIAGLRGKAVRWSHPASAVDTVYVTQVLAQKKGRYVAQYGELSLLLANGRFFTLLTASDIHDLREPAALTPGETVTDLTQADVTTDLQAAALYVAQALGRPCRYDRRVK